MSKQTFTVEVEAIRPLTAGEVRQAIVGGQRASTRTTVTETTPFDPQPRDKVHLKGTDPRMTFDVVARDGDLCWVKETTPENAYNTLCDVASLSPVR